MGGGKKGDLSKTCSCPFVQKFIKNQKVVVKPGGSRILADVHISLHMFIHVYIFSFVFAYVLCVLYIFLDFFI